MLFAFDVLLFAFVRSTDQVRFRLLEEKTFDVIKMSLEDLKNQTDILQVLNFIGQTILEKLGKEVFEIDTVAKFGAVFSNKILDKPLVLILDEFDALLEEAIHAIVGVFRGIYTSRQQQTTKKTSKKDYLLHGLAL